MGGQTYRQTLADDRYDGLHRRRGRGMIGW